MTESKIKPLLIKYRTWQKGIAPRKIKLEIPGWAGDSWDHKDGAKPMPWHCTPFVDGSTYGLELIYNFQTEAVVRNTDGVVTFEGDFSKEAKWVQKQQSQNDKSDPQTPFMMFAPGHYGHTSGVDIQPPEGYCLRIEPHPRFYTDTTGTCPIPVAGHIQRWWPRIFFIAFKAPLPGQFHVFRPGEAMCQVLIVPEISRYNLQQMTDEEQAHRHVMDEIIAQQAKHICTRQWKDHTDNVFDDKYKVLKAAHSKGGMKGVENKLFSVRDEQKKAQDEKMKSARNVMKRKLLHKVHSVQKPSVIHETL